MKTRNQAIIFARKNVTGLYKIGNGWSYNVWDEDCRAWRQGMCKPFAVASRDRCSAMVLKAMEWLHEDREAGLSASYNYDCKGGQWTDYVQLYRFPIGCLIN